MEKKLAGLLGAVSALALATPASAAPNLDAVMQVTSYADLLQPIPNATVLLAASDAQLVPSVDHQADPAVLTVQYYDHHHHHRRPPPRRRYHHHHHHHQDHHHHNAASRIIGGVMAGLAR